MFTIIVRNSRNGRDVTIRTLNRKRVEEVGKHLWPNETTNEAELKAKADFQKMLDEGEE